jgi:hypothetical protein
VHPINVAERHSESLQPRAYICSTAIFSAVERTYVAYPVSVFAQPLSVCAPCTADIFLEQPVAHDQQRGCSDSGAGGSAKSTKYGFSSSRHFQTRAPFF